MHKSTTKTKDLEPTWEEVFTFAAFDERASLSLEVYDHDDIGLTAASLDSRRVDGAFMRPRRVDAVAAPVASICGGYASRREASRGAHARARRFRRLHGFCGCAPRVLTRQEAGKALATTEQ